MGNRAASYNRQTRDAQHTSNVYQLMVKKKIGRDIKKIFLPRSRLSQFPLFYYSGFVEVFPQVL